MHCSQESNAWKNDQAKRSPKRVLAALVLGEPNRERHCWRATPLATLRERGTENCLTAYLDEVAPIRPIHSSNSPFDPVRRRRSASDASPSLF